MAKMTPAKTPIYKNIFAQLFGNYLRKQRLNSKLGFEEMSQVVGVSGSFYRYLESGGTLFNPTRAYNLLEVFPEIEWEPLIKFLVAGQMLDAGMGSWKELETQTKRIAERDPQLKKLITPLNSIWDLDPIKQQKEIDSIIESDTMFFEFDEYLRHNKYYSLKSDEALNAEIKDIIFKSSSMFLDHTLNSLEDLTTLPMAVLQEDMHVWENKHQNRFRDIYSLTRDTDVLLTEKNLKQYTYDFLQLQSFRKLRYLFISEKDEDDLKDKFLHGLKKHSAKTDAFITDVRNKIEFKCIKETHETKHIIDLLTIDNNEFNSFWIWKMNNDRFIGFCSHIVMEDLKTLASFWKIPIKHLSIKQVYNSRKILENFWNNQTL